MRTRNVGIFLYDDVEVLDFAGPFEVFATASRLSSESGGPPFAVATIARTETIEARGGLVVKAAHGLSDHPPVDVLVVPGGIIDREVERPEVSQWIAAVARRAEVVAGVCTGAFFLARSGLLVGKSATTHWEDAHDLSRRYPDIRVQTNVRWVDTGSVVTSAGIAAGIDVALYLVARLAGPPLAERTAKQIAYEWRPTSGVVEKA